MKSLLLMTAFLWCACGDNVVPPLLYTDPGPGKLRLVKDPRSALANTVVVLDLVVGDQPLTGYSVGFDLPLDDSKIVFAGFTPGTALAPGAAPVAAAGMVPSTGPLAHQIVTAQSQKASGAGAVATDTPLDPDTVLYSFELDLVSGAPIGVVFDGTAQGFILPSGGMRDRTGTTVVGPLDVAIGRLEVTK